MTGTPGGTGWNCGASAGQNVSCTRSDILTPGTSYPAITVNYTVVGTAPGGSVFTNTATVNGGGDPTAPHSASAQVLVPNPSVPDLTITKSHTGNFTQGQVGATYTLTVLNILPTATSGTVTVVDTLPAGLTATGISGVGWSCTLSSLSCLRNDSLAGNSSYPIITVTVNVAANATGTLVNTAVVGGGGEVNLSNDTATDPVVIQTIPDMTISKTHAGTSFSQGGSVTFTLTASNVGTGATVGAVTVKDTLPAGLTATAISGAAPWICQPLPALACSRSDSLAVNASYSPISVTATIGANVTGTLVNTSGSRRRR